MIRHREGSWVSVDVWPVIQFKPVVHHTALKQLSALNSHLNHLDQRVLKKVEEAEGVLVLDDILDHFIHSQDLVLLQCDLKRSHDGLEALLVVDLHLVEERIVHVVLRFVKILKKLSDDPTLKTENLHQI